ncbi:hypothetical protein [Rhodoblastus sp.]|uniref:hypothetical protein n=1 Tax=Rhodoblastus sp. TaxID=1962975 RepID=UPI00263263CE|nr:hypothetical protein [Rhodoblastus sp.]
MAEGRCRPRLYENAIVHLLTADAASDGRPVSGIIQADAARPSVGVPGVLARRHVLQTVEAVWKEVTPPIRLEDGQPILDGFSRLFRQLELDRPPSLFLDHRRTVARPTVCLNVIDFQADEAAAAQFAVDRHANIARSRFPAMI